MRQPSALYKRHRFPGEIISHAVWLYHRFLLSYCDVEELLADRGIAVSYETVRRWCKKFGQRFADGVRRRRARPGNKWHIDEVQLKINGRKRWLWRAVDQNGVVLDILVQARRNQKAAEAFLRRLADGHGYWPRVVVTDKLASYPPALRRALPGVEHRRHKGPNNRAENSHRPTHRREPVLQRFKSPRHAQHFLKPFSALCNRFRPAATSCPPSSTGRSAPSASSGGETWRGSGPPRERAHQAAIARPHFPDPSPTCHSRTPAECAAWSRRCLRCNGPFLAMMDADERRRPPGAGTTALRLIYNYVIMAPYYPIYRRLELRRLARSAAEAGGQASRRSRLGWRVPVVLAGGALRAWAAWRRLAR